MTKNKTLAVVLVVLFVLALIVALGQSVFRVGKVELVAHSTTNYLSALNENTVLSGSKLNKGSSVFLLDRDTYCKNLEASQPYIKVLSIEVVWPNTIKFHYSERTELFALPLNDGAYAYVDGDFKVLKVSQGAFSSTQQNSILLEQPLDKSSAEVRAGDFLNQQDFSDFVDIDDAFLDMGYSLSELKSMVRATSTTTDAEGKKLNLNTFLGVNIQILNSAFYTSQKITLAYQMLDTLTEQERSHGTIYVFKNSQNVLESRYIA